MKKWSLISENEALYRIDKYLKIPDIGVETVKVNDALGRVCGEDIYSQLDVPGFRRSTVDGYAVSMNDLENRKVTRLKISCKAEMGKVSDRHLQRGECAYIPTGGSVPPNADSVIMLEDVVVEKCDDGEYAVVGLPEIMANIVAGDEDFSRGELIARSGKILGCADIGKLGAVGLKEVIVKMRPKVYIISTGDELESDSGKSIPDRGKIFNINENVIATISRKLGLEPVGYCFSKDDIESLRKDFIKGLGEADIIVFSGGSSVGDKDFVREIIESFDESKIHFHGVKIKPGKPTIFANIGKKVVIGLPGHPASTYMIYTHFGGYMAEKCFRTYKRNFKVGAAMAHDLYMPRDRDTLQIVEIVESEDNLIDCDTYRMEMYSAVPLFGKSAVISKIARSHGYIVLRTDGRVIKKGEKVYVQMFD